MSRIIRYQKDITRFIKSQYENKMMDKIDETIYNNLLNMDYFEAIILISIVSNLNLQSHLTTHGYYSGLIIIYLKNLIDIVNSIKTSINEYYDVLIRIIILINRTIITNMEYIDNKNQIFILKIINEKILKLIYSKLEYVRDEKMNNNDLIKDYKKNNIAKYINDIYIFKKSLYTEYINNRYVIISQLAILIGWITGNGAVEMKESLLKIGEYLGILIKLYNDFKNLDDDVIKLQETVKNSKFVDNYIINYGIQDAFELYLNNKKKFIEGCMTLQIYTITIQEIIDTIDATILQKINENSK